MTDKHSTHSTREHALYRFWDADRQLLYVGISLNPGNRWKQHAHDKAWWLDVAHVTVEPHPTKQAALDAERDAITTEHPRHNIVHNAGTATHRAEGPTPPATDPAIIAQVRAEQATRAAERQDYVDAFFDTWPQYRHHRLPQGIATTIAGYHDAGLPLLDMVDAARLALGKRDVGDRVAYFRAICRNRIEGAARG